MQQRTKYHFCNLWCSYKYSKSNFFSLKQIYEHNTGRQRKIDLHSVPIAPLNCYEKRCMEEEMTYFSKLKIAGNL